MNRAERRRQKAQQRAAAKAIGRRHLYAVHVARSRTAPHIPRVQRAILEWFDRARYQPVRCGGCDHCFDHLRDPRVPQAFVFALPQLNPSADAFGIALCADCAQQSDDDLVTTAETAMRAAGGAGFRRLPVHMVHAEGGRA